MVTITIRWNGQVVEKILATSYDYSATLRMLTYETLLSVAHSPKKHLIYLGANDSLRIQTDS